MASNCYLVLTTGFLLCFTFCLVLPILPFCLARMFRAKGTTMNIVLSYCAVTSLYVHPFSKCLLSALTHGPLCLITCFVFVAVFTNCVLTKILSLFVVLQIIRNLTFKVIAMTKGAVIVSVAPSSHHNRTMKCCKLVGGATVDFNPVVNLFVRSVCSFRAVFTYSLVSKAVNFITTYLIGAPPGRPIGQRPVSLSHFILLGNVPTKVTLLLLSVPCNVADACMTVCTGRVKVALGSKLFFAFVTINVTISHVFSNGRISGKHVARIVALKLCLMYDYFFVLSTYKLLVGAIPRLAGVLFFVITLLLKMNFKAVFPTFGALFMGLTPGGRHKATASACLAS